MRAAVRLLVIAHVATACGRDSPQSFAGASVDTLANGAVHVRYAGDVADLGRRIDATVVVSIGAVEGQGADVFARVGDIALSADGRTLYVLDSRDRELRTFRDDGSHVRSVGRQGGGPGEFGSARGMSWSPAGTLWIADFGNQRYTELSADGELVGTRARRSFSTDIEWHGGFDADGYLYDTAMFVVDGNSRTVLVRFRVESAAVTPLDSFPVPDMRQEAYTMDFAPGRRLLIPVPFTPRPSWALGDGALWTAAAERYVIAKQSLAGDTLLLLQVDADAAAIPAAEREAARAQLEAQFAGAPAGTFDASRIPARRPAHGRIRVDHRGRLWVPRGEDLGAAGNGSTTPTPFNVFEADGRYVGEVVLPIDPDRAIAFADGRVAGVALDELGVERVLLLEVEL
jgi:hypothetical protein